MTHRNLTAALVVLGAIAVISSPAVAQEAQAVRDVLGQAQSGSQRRAVEDLLNRLRGTQMPMPMQSAGSEQPPLVTASAPGVAAAMPMPQAPIAPASTPSRQASQSPMPVPTAVPAPVAPTVAIPGPAAPVVQVSAPATAVLALRRPAPAAQVAATPVMPVTPAVSLVPAERTAATRIVGAVPQGGPAAICVDGAYGPGRPPVGYSRSRAP